MANTKQRLMKGELPTQIVQVTSKWPANCQLIASSNCAKKLPAQTVQIASQWTANCQLKLCKLPAKCQQTANSNCASCQQFDSKLPTANSNCANCQQFDSKLPIQIVQIATNLLAILPAICQQFTSSNCANCQQSDSSNCANYQQSASKADCSNCADVQHSASKMTIQIGHITRKWPPNCQQGQLLTAKAGC